MVNGDEPTATVVQADQLEYGDIAYLYWKLVIAEPPSSTGAVKVTESEVVEAALTVKLDTAAGAPAII